MCCTVVTLVPQKLFEFRYFMVPYMILQIFDPRQKDETKSKIIFQIFYNITITAATLYIFKTKGSFCKILLFSYIYIIFQKYFGMILKKYKECFGDFRKSS